MSEAILTVEKLKKHFPITKGILFAKTLGWVKAVDEVDFEVYPGQTVALVGESGSGKTTTAFCVLRLHTPTSGIIRLGGADISKFQGEELANYRKSVQAMFQDPYSSLNPRLRVRSIVAEPLKVNTAMSRSEIDDRVREALAQVGLPAEAPDLYPHEFSGGQRQRIALARALALKPKLVVLDEPVSGLDVSIRAQVMNLLKDLQQKLGVAYLLISHNLADVRYMSDWVGVMYLGRMVEWASSEELFTNPVHPYTQALLSAALPFRPGVEREEITLPGEIPGPTYESQGCQFQPRCFRATDLCCQGPPRRTAVNSQHYVSCHLFQ
jgi:peptide/nickel transport system ATP-binding protein/oligopeptide transport system ATP-binding protein